METVGQGSEKEQVFANLRLQEIEVGEGRANNFEEDKRKVRAEAAFSALPGISNGSGTKEDKRDACGVSCVAGRPGEPRERMVVGVKEGEARMTQRMGGCEG